MNTMKKAAILIFIVSLSTTLGAQEFGFGIKAGLSFSTFSGEIVDQESYDNKSGFHVGPSFTFRFSKLFSLRAEVLYNQLGTDYEFNGPSRFTFYSTNGNPLEVGGHKELSQSVYLNYFDVPLQATFKLGNTFEIYGGVNILFLGGATSGGVLDFYEDSEKNPNDDMFSTTLDYRYNRDKAKEIVDDETTEVRFNGRRYDVPGAIGAYYEHDEKDGRTFNTIDYGIHGGARFFFNNALYLEGRFYYGLSDVTNNKMDIHQFRENANSPKFSDDKDTNLSIQLSLGFSF